MAGYSSYIEKMTIADRSRNDRTNGFQGCANRGRGCDARGFDLCIYSEDGLCSNCELKTFPDRYSGCGFCGKAIKYTLFCWNCHSHFSQWLFNLFYNKNNKSKSTTSCFKIPSDDETNDWKLWQIIGIGCYRIARTFIGENENMNTNPIREFVEPKMDGPWSGFYVGDGKYVKPDPFELKSKICISDITWENSKFIMLRELEKLQIFPYDVIQIKN